MASRDDIELILEPDGPRFLLTEKLLALFTSHSHLRSELIGEVLLRLGLFPDTAENAGLVAALRQTGIHPSVIPTISSDDRQEFENMLNLLEPNLPEPVAYTRRHWSWFKSCDGVIPVLIEEREAFPVPFRLVDENFGKWGIYDVENRLIPRWNDHLHHVEHACDARIRCQLLIHAGSRAEDFSGLSFCLPVAIAHSRHNSRLPEFAPLRLVASGEISVGCVESAAGLKAKRMMAENMRAVFFTPGDSDAGGQTSLWDNVILEVERFLEEHRLSRLTVPQTKARLKRLQEELHTGKAGPEEALRMTGFLLRNINPDDVSPMVVEAKITSELICSSAANHTGDSVTSREHLNRAEKLCETSKDPNLHVHLWANLVVQLTDVFALDEAEKAGRELLDYVETKYTGAAEAHHAAKMRATGALGGQPLLTLAMRDKTDPQESKILLEECYRLAEEIHLPSECCRGITQLAQWHAIFQPFSFFSVYEQAGQVFRRYRQDSVPSSHYLDAYRLLAARRRVLFADGVLEADFDNWRVPDIEAGAPHWLSAIALKYRAVLNAHAGKTEQCAQDLTNAIELLVSDKAPLIRLIRTSISLEWLLLAGQVDCPHSVQDLIEELKSCRHPEADRWAVVLTQNTSRNTLLRFAKEFRY